MTIAAMYTFFDAMYIIYCGALRGAGDTLVPAVGDGEFVLDGVVSEEGIWWHGVSRGSADGAVGITLGYGITLGIFMWRRFAAGSMERSSLAGRAGESRVCDFLMENWRNLVRPMEFDKGLTGEGLVAGVDDWRREYGFGKQLRRRVQGFAEPAANGVCDGAKLVTNEPVRLKKWQEMGALSEADGGEEGGEAVGSCTMGRRLQMGTFISGM